MSFTDELAAAIDALAERQAMERSTLVETLLREHPFVKAIVPDIRAARAAAPVRAGELRDAIVRIVREKPGITVNEVASGLGLAWTTVRYQLGRLHHDNRIVVEKRGRSTHLFAPELAAAQRREAQLGGNPMARDTVDFLGHNSSAGVFEIAQALGVSSKLTRRLLNELVAAEIVSKTGSARPQYALNAQALPRFRALHGFTRHS